MDEWMDGRTDVCRWLLHIYIYIHDNIIHYILIRNYESCPRIFDFRLTPCCIDSEPVKAGGVIHLLSQTGSHNVGL
jgi:hypothetical protein